MPAYTPEEKKLLKFIDDAVGPLNRRIAQLEKDMRRIKSENQSLKNQIARKK